MYSQKPHQLGERVFIHLPNEEVFGVPRQPEALIAKGVVEDFARRFLKEPAVVWLCYSDSLRFALRRTCHEILRRDPENDDALPPIIIADVCTDSPKIVFVEVVATDGPINEQRKQALLQVASAAGHETSHVYFVSAFAHRTAPAFRKLVAEIAWGTFVWFTSEPDKLLIFKEGQTSERSSFLSQ